MRKQIIRTHLVLIRVDIVLNLLVLLNQIINYMHRKLPLLLPLILLFGLNTSKAQTITNLRMLPTVPLFTDSILLEVTTFYPFGGGGQGPRLENPDIQQYGDTILIMGYYDFGGIWQAFMSGSIDTIALGQLTQGN
jgi:hypothetical protein